MKAACTTKRSFHWSTRAEFRTAWRWSVCYNIYEQDLGCFVVLWLKKLPWCPTLDPEWCSRIQASQNVWTTKAVQAQFGFLADHVSTTRPAGRREAGYERQILLPNVERTKSLTLEETWRGTAGDVSSFQARIKTTWSPSTRNEPQAIQCKDWGTPRIRGVGHTYPCECIWDMLKYGTY